MKTKNDKKIHLLHQLIYPLLDPKTKMPKLEVSQVEKGCAQFLIVKLKFFLNGGGKINFIKPNVMGDPPKRPESSYGSKPI